MESSIYFIVFEYNDNDRQSHCRDARAVCLSNITYSHMMGHIDQVVDACIWQKPQLKL